MKNTTPFKRALRNSLFMAFIVGGLLHFQGSSTLNSLLTSLYTFGIILPALWLSYRYTQKVMLRIEARALAKQQSKVEEPEKDKVKTETKEIA